MLAGVEGVSDYIFDYGKGNLCASCHKPRAINPKPDPTKTAQTDVITITSSRWHQHYGVQGSMLSGHGGFEFLGYTYSTSYHGFSALIHDEGCIICHMAQEERNPAGGHTMWLKYEDTEMIAGCNTAGCHNNNLLEINYENVQTQTELLLDSLKVLLLNRGWITPSGSVNASASNPLIISPAFLSGAMFNYFFVEHDGSLGIHNANYAQQLLESSIEVLNSN